MIKPQILVRFNIVALVESPFECVKCAPCYFNTETQKEDLVSLVSALLPSKCSVTQCRITGLSLMWMDTEELSVTYFSTFDYNH